jgi:2-polyprenyl-3-methyl-5-hydroxy-6-metoxy-1,4-benzoquinol methylase
MRRPETISCKLCRGSLTERKYALRGNIGIDFDAAECEVCGLFQVVYDWKAKEPLTLSTDADEALADPLWGSEQELRANESKAMTFAQRLATDGLLRGARVLEIGCGRGFFLRACRNLGASVVIGQEFRSSDITHARDVLGIEDIRPVETNRADVWPDDEFDLVCSFDVLEHVHDLKTVFEQCLRLVRPGGYFFHATPGYDSLSHRLGRVLGRYSPTERTMLLAGVLSNVEPALPGHSGGHVSILGSRQLRWLEQRYALQIENMEYVSSYSFSNSHYAAVIPYLRKLPTRLGASMFAVVRASVRNKLVFLLRVPD